MDRTTLFQNIHDAPGAERRKRQSRERNERAVRIHRFGEEAAGLGQERRSATRCLGILGKPAFAQRAEEHLLGNLSLELERIIGRARNANLDPEGLGLPIVGDDGPHAAVPVPRTLDRRGDGLIQYLNAVAICPVEKRAQRSSLSRRE
jgi:hypothetical protein